MKLSPIILFVYARPVHTLKSLQAIKSNKLSGQSKLLIYADGPKEDASPEDLRNIEKVRELIRSDQWCGEIEIKEIETNVGLEQGFHNGLKYAFETYDSLIILEDDVVVSQVFLDYMNAMLNHYWDEDRVMSICGYTLPVNWPKFEIIQLRGSFGASGWGTWKKAWETYNPDNEELYSKLMSLDKQSKSRFNNLDTLNFLSVINHTVSYDLKWYSTVFLQNKFNIWPSKSFVQNIGWDGSGAHCPTVDNYMHKELMEEFDFSSLQIPETLEDNAEFVKEIARFCENDPLQKKN